MDQLRGALRWQEITQASGAGGDTFLNVRPPDGEVWDIYAISAIHDDAARTIDWMTNDVDTGSYGSLYNEAAVTARRYWGPNCGIYQPVRIHYKCYIMYKVTAMAAAKTITGEVLYERIVGWPTDLGK